MSLVFVVFFYFTLLCVAVAFFTALALVLTYFFGGKNLRKRKLFAAAILPGVGVTVFCLSLGVGEISFRTSRGLDPGVGDFWQAPLSNGYTIYFVDRLSGGHITHQTKQFTEIPEVGHVLRLREDGEALIGIREKFRGEKEAFVLDTATQTLTVYPEASEPFAVTEKSPLTPAFQFYIEKREQLLGKVPTVILGLSVVFTLALLFGLGKLIFLIKRPAQTDCPV